MKKYMVKLSQQEREELQGLISTGKSSARTLMHARVLLQMPVKRDQAGKMSRSAKR